MPAQGFPPPPPGSAPGGSMPAISLTGSPKAPAWERASREKRGSVSAADGPQCPDTRSRPRYLAGLRPYRGRDRHRRGHASGHRPPAALGLRQDEDERTAARRRLTRRNESREEATALGPLVSSAHRCRGVVGRGAQAASVLDSLEGWTVLTNDDGGLRIEISRRAPHVPK